MQNIEKSAGHILVRGFKFIRLSFRRRPSEYPSEPL